MNKTHKSKTERIILPLIRFLVFAMFIISGIAKMFPLWAFEKQMVDLGICDWCTAHWLARFIIAGELTLGIAILQRNFLRTLIIPAATLMLLGFCVHLSLQIYQSGGTTGNCGCFGQLIPMTPLEALIKNIITIGLLLFLWFRHRAESRRNFLVPLSIFLFSALSVFVFFPFCPCKKEIASVRSPAFVSVMHEHPRNLPGKSSSTEDENTASTLAADAAPSLSTTENEEGGPANTPTPFSAYRNFQGKTADLSRGKKIVCMFAAGCDECRAAGSALVQLGAQVPLPPVYILFMDEETGKIPEFISVTGCRYPYTIISVPEFWQLLGGNSNTPGLFYLWNGNVIRFYQGEESQKFDPADLKRALKSS